MDNAKEGDGQGKGGEESGGERRVDSDIDSDVDSDVNSDVDREGKRDTDLNQLQHFKPFWQSVFEPVTIVVTIIEHKPSQVSVRAFTPLLRTCSNLPTPLTHTTCT
jgi:cobalamin biosynthesis protein CobT